MNIFLRCLLIAAAVTLSSFTFNSIAKDTTSQNLKETRQQTQIWTTIALSPYLSGDQISVSVSNDKATLSGHVSDDVRKELAEEIAKGVEDIASVDNQLVIRERANGDKPSKERSYGDVISDATITTLVKSKLLWSKYAEGLNTHVETHKSNVILKGTAESGTAREMAGLLAKSTDGVKSVDNKIVVENSKPSVKDKMKKESKNAEGNVADSWITTKVKYTLMYSSQVSGSDISVNTENGIVSLSGATDNGSERALAIQLAENIKGVKSVNSSKLINK